MSGAAEAADVLAVVPGVDAGRATIVPLSGGRNNRSYLVEDGARRYVLRLSDGMAAAGGAGFEQEAAIQSAAAHAGIAPAVVHADASSGVLVSEYLAGGTLHVDDLQNHAVLQELARTLRTLHSLPPCGVRYASVEAATAYRDALAAAGGDDAFADFCLAIVADTAGHPERACCHNDVLAANLVRGDSLYLVDFEYAADNEPLFDLACVIGWHHLGQHAADVLLDEYAGGSNNEWRERLDLQLRRFDAVQWLWLAAAARRDDTDREQMARARARLAGR